MFTPISKSTFGVDNDINYSITFIYTSTKILSEKEKNILTELLACLIAPDISIIYI
jgi:hypothetical protein